MGLINFTINPSSQVTSEHNHPFSNTRVRGEIKHAGPARQCKPKQVYSNYYSSFVFVFPSKTCSQDNVLRIVVLSIPLHICLPMGLEHL